jgi:hypothetical protein
MASQRLRRRGLALIGLLALALVFTSATIELRAGSAGAVDRVLEATFRLVIPLFTLAIVAAVSSRGNLSDAAWSAARFGARHSAVALGLLAAAVLASAGSAALLAAFSVAAAHTKSAPPLAADAALSAYIGAITAAAYAGWLGLGSTFFRFGQGRLIFIILDFLIGGSAGLMGAIFPRGNATNLLGGAAPLGLSQPSSTAILILSAAALCLAAAARCKR